MKALFITFFFISHTGFCQNPEAVADAPEIFSLLISGSVCWFSANGKTIYFSREDTLQKNPLFMKQTAREINGSMPGFCLSQENITIWEED